jgi:hypothetical protein
MPVPTKNQVSKINARNRPFGEWLASLCQRRQENDSLTPRKAGIGHEWSFTWTLPNVGLLIRNPTLAPIAAAQNDHCWEQLVTRLNIISGKIVRLTLRTFKQSQWART